MRAINATTLRQWICSDAEIAVLDPREEGEFSRMPHLFHACNVPLSQLELRIAALVPRRSTRIVVAGDGGALDERTRRRLEELGYSGAAVLLGGPHAWEQAGFPLFTGFNTPSKAFGEFIETSCHTPAVSPEELQRWRSEGKRFVLLDSRTPEEHGRATIPGSISTPGAELVLRYAELAPDPATPIVVNCAGRTRSIIGAQSLINAGAPNPVFALRNGTMGWALAGLDVETGAQRRAPEPSPENVLRAQEAADRFRARFGIGTIGWDELSPTLGGRGVRTTYLLDVRSVAEYEAGHPRGALCAPGGQLVQATDTWVAVRRAVIVLYDPIGVRDVTTASWLKQMGHRDVLTLIAKSVAPHDLVAGPQHAEVLRRRPVEAPRLESEYLLRNRDAFEVIDLASSRAYAQAHVPGASWSTRAGLRDALAALRTDRPVVLVSPDGVLAELAFDDLCDECDVDVSVLAGGMQAWRACSLPLEAGKGRHLVDANDVFVKPFEAQDRSRSMRDYLDWEVGLLDAVKRHPAIDFGLSMR